MTNSASYILTPTGITAVIRGRQYTVTSDNPAYGQVVDAIRNDEPIDEIEALFDKATAIKRYTIGNVEVRDGALYYKGEQLHNIVVDRILQFMGEGLPVGPLIRFLERLLANPSRRSIQELYTFMEHKKMPITEDGYLLAYKGVNDNYTDVHSGKFDNSVGVSNEMARGTVDDDFRKGCSFGFHVGSLEYATNWGPRTVIVQVDPADVVSVPEDSNFQKMRVAKYTVVDDYQGALNDTFANAAAPYGERNAATVDSPCW